MGVSCYHSFWVVNCECVYALLHWGLLLVSASRYLVKVCKMSNLSALTFELASRSCLRIYLVCLVATRTIYLVLKTVSRDAEEVIKVSSYLFLGFHWLQQCSCLENLPFPLLALVGDQALRKDDGTDFGCILIQSYSLIALEIKCCSWDLFTHALPCLFLGIGEGFLTNLCYFPKIAKKHTVLFLCSTLNDSNTHLVTCCCFSTPSFHNLST